ncbi:PAS domain-containing protein [Novosphingobium resinovorum]
MIARKSEFEFDAAGNAVRMIGAVRDVTDRTRTQLALEKSEAQFSALAQNMPTQVWTARADGAMDWFNERTYAYSGEPHGSLDGDGWARLVHPEDRQTAVERWAQAVASGEVYDTELRLRDCEGSIAGISRGPCRSRTPMVPSLPGSAQIPRSKRRSRQRPLTRRTATGSGRSAATSCWSAISRARSRR